MPERIPPTAVFYGSAKPETAKPPAKDSRFVTGVKKAVNSWLERIGPTGVENHFIEVHKHIVSALSPAERKKITATEIASWRRIAKIVGVTATVIDAGLIAFGVGFSVVNRNRPNEAVNNYTDLLTRVFSDGNGDVSLENPLARLAIIPYDIRGPGLITMSDQRIHRFGRLLTNIPGFAAGGALVAGGPAHWFTHLAASGAETIGKMKAKSQK